MKRCRLDARVQYEVLMFIYIVHVFIRLVPNSSAALTTYVRTRHSAWLLLFCLRIPSTNRYFSWLSSLHFLFFVRYRIQKCKNRNQHSRLGYMHACMHTDRRQTTTGLIRIFQILQFSHVSFLGRRTVF